MMRSLRFPRVLLAARGRRAGFKQNATASDVRVEVKLGATREGREPQDVVAAELGITQYVATSPARLASFARRSSRHWCQHWCQIGPARQSGDIGCGSRGDSNFEVACCRRASILRSNPPRSFASGCMVSRPVGVRIGVKPFEPRSPTTLPSVDPHANVAVMRR
jgi:hypothetical protein